MKLKTFLNACWSRVTILNRCLNINEARPRDIIAEHPEIMDEKVESFEASVDHKNVIFVVLK